MRTFVVLILIVAIAACAREPQPTSGKSASAPSSTPELRRDKPAVGTQPKIVFLGDSLTAGLGLSSDQSYPALIGRKLKEQGYDYEIVNAGVSGDTSAGGLRRLDWSLEGDRKSTHLNSSHSQISYAVFCLK